MDLRRKKSKSEPIEATMAVEQKIELVTNTDPKINTFSNDLQSELDEFVSELDESIESNLVDIKEPEAVEIKEPEVVETKEPEVVELKELEVMETKKSKKSRSSKASKSSRSSKSTGVKGSNKDETNLTQKSQEKEPKKPKKVSSKKTKTKEPEKVEIKEHKVQEINETPMEKTPSTVKTESKEAVEKEKKEELVDINFLTESISDPTIQASVLSIYNENAELKANLEKAKRIIRILKKKLDLAEEKEEQWRLCANNLGDIFAEKSHMPLEDVLRRFEAPLDEVEV